MIFHGFRIETRIGEPAVIFFFKTKKGTEFLKNVLKESRKIISGCGQV